MKVHIFFRILMIVSVLTVSTDEAVSYAQPPVNNNCRGEYRAIEGYVHSFASPFFPGSQTACNVYVSSKSTKTTYDMQAGGLTHIATPDGKTIHSYQFVSPGSSESRFQRAGDRVEVRQGTLNWRFSDKDMKLRDVVDSSSGRSCSAAINSEAVAMRLADGSAVDLNACSSVMAIDLGSSTTRQTAPLMRDRWAKVQGSVNGVLQTCEVQIGELFDYQVGETILKQGAVVVVESGYNPCYMYVVKEFAHLPLPKAYEEFNKKYPTHSCRSTARATSAQATKSYRTLRKGLEPLSPDQDISYQIKPVSEVRLALLNRGRGTGCRLLAAKADSGRYPAPSRHPSPGAPSGPLPPTVRFFMTSCGR